MDEKLGKEGRDKVTGFKGIIVAKLTALFGCSQYGLAPPLNKDGTRADTCYFDEGRIEIIGKGIKPEEVKGEKPGGLINIDAPPNN